MLDPWLFLLAAGTLLIAPGPTNTLLATAGAGSGIVRALPTLLAAVAGYLIAIAILRFALGPVIAAYPMVSTGLKLAAAAYLVWIAIMLWRRTPAELGTHAVGVRDVFVATLLNPKALIFSLTIFPAVTPNIGWYVAGFVAEWMVVGVVWISIGAGLGAAAGTRANLLPKIASVALVGFAGFLVSSTI